MKQYVTIKEIYTDKNEIVPIGVIFHEGFCITHYYFNKEKCYEFPASVVENMPAYFKEVDDHGKDQSTDEILGKIFEIAFNEQDFRELEDHNRQINFINRFLDLIKNNKYKIVKLDNENKHEPKKEEFVSDEIKELAEKLYNAFNRGICPSFDNQPSGKKSYHFNEAKYVLDNYIKKDEIRELISHINNIIIPHEAFFNEVGKSFFNGKNQAYVYVKKLLEDLVK